MFLYTRDKKPAKYWVAAKWIATAFLWSQWLMQDAANLFVYLPRKLDFWQMLLSMTAFLLLLGIVCYKRGGEIQNILKFKIFRLEIPQFVCPYILKHLHPPNKILSIPQLYSLLSLYPMLVPT